MHRSRRVCSGRSGYRQSSGNPKERSSTPVFPPWEPFFLFCTFENGFHFRFDGITGIGGPSHTVHPGCRSFFHRHAIPAGQESPFVNPSDPAGALLIPPPNGSDDSPILSQNHRRVDVTFVSLFPGVFFRGQQQISRCGALSIKQGNFASRASISPAPSAGSR